MTKVDVDGVILETQSDPRYPVAKKRRKIKPQRIIITSASHTKQMVSNFTRNINDCRLIRVNTTRVKLKGLDLGNRNPKVDTIKLAHMWEIGVGRANKTIIETTQNDFQDATRQLTK